MLASRRCCSLRFRRRGRPYRQARLTTRTPTAAGRPAWPRPGPSSGQNDTRRSDWPVLGHRYQSNTQRLPFPSKRVMASRQSAHDFWMFHPTRHRRPSPLQISHWMTRGKFPPPTPLDPVSKKSKSRSGILQEAAHGAALVRAVSSASARLSYERPSTKPLRGSRRSYLVANIHVATG